MEAVSWGCWKERLTEVGGHHSALEESGESTTKARARYDDGDKRSPYQVGRLGWRLMLPPAGPAEGPGQAPRPACSAQARPPPSRIARPAAPPVPPAPVRTHPPGRGPEGPAPTALPATSGGVAWRATRSRGHGHGHRG